MHLRYASFPILNDIGYGGRYVGNFYGKYKLKFHPTFEDKLESNQEQIIQKDNEGELGKRESLDKNGDDIDVEDMLKYKRFDGTKLMEIFLHAKQYTFEERVFETEEPYWASKNFTF